MEPKDNPNDLLGACEAEQTEHQVGGSIKLEGVIDLKEVPVMFDVGPGRGQLQPKNHSHRPGHKM